MRRIVPLTLLALAPFSAPAPAGAAEVGRQVERRAPARFPADVGGCSPRCVRGRPIPRGWVLLSRTIRLEPRERRVSATFRCPGGRRFRTFGHLEGGDVILQIPSSQFPYTRRTRVRI